jgi:hypothetical protein
MIPILRVCSHLINLDMCSLITRREVTLGVGRARSNINVGQRWSAKAGGILTARSNGQMNHMMQPHSSINIRVLSVCVLESGALADNHAFGARLRDGGVGIIPTAC